jgi:type I restriction enzyme S subunit
MVEKKRVPELRFKEFSGEWEEKELEYLIEISKKKINPKTDNKNYKCVELEHLSQNSGLLLGFTNSKEQQSIKNYFEENQVLFGKLRPYLRKFWKSDFVGVCSTEIWVLNGKKFLNSYLFQFIQTNKFNQIANISSGSKMPRADWSFMKDYPFYYPSLQEQEKIANFLSSVDKRIEQLTKKVELLKKYKKGVMQKIFSGEIRFKNENGEDYPDWVEKKIKDVLVESKILGNKGNIAKKITVKLWGKGVFEKKDILEGSENTQYYKRKAGQLIYSKLDFLNCAFGIIPDNLNEYESTIDLPCFDIKQNSEPVFLLEYIKQKSFYKKYGEKADGSRKAKRINQPEFLQMPIPLPSLPEQTKIANFLSSIDEQIEQTQKSLDKTKEWKKGLLQKMFV